ncbi:MAG: hypothetical protein KAR06_07080, partial [Deltaproteobacteria bacterium]|nr:hypothetical protein [Deltaproteobacteria bacterium]
SPKSYHPVFAKGTNRPEDSSVRNPNWCAEGGSTYLGTGCTNGATGARLDLEGTVYSETLSQTFVEPWKHDSLLTCVDCHEDTTETAPRGPHGSTRPFILRQVDASISMNLVGGGTMDYSGMTSAANEQRTFCFNCHRADVYTYGTQGGTSRANFARQPHPAAAKTNDEGTLTGDTVAGGNRGISCMGCHGGGGGYTSTAACSTTTCKLGNIHGSDDPSVKTTTGGGTSDGGPNRLIASDGYWEWWMRGDTGNSEAGAVFCFRNSEDLSSGWNDCSNTSDGTGQMTTYDYP